MGVDGKPRQPEGHGKHDVRRLAPDAGKRTSDPPSMVGNSPPWRSTIASEAMPRRWDAFERKKPVDRMMSSSSARSAAAKSRGVG